MDSAKKSLQEMYRDSGERVRKVALSKEGSSGDYKRYVDFITAIKSDSSTLLDVGCGSGWSSYHLVQAGLDVTGMDLHSASFEPKINKNLKYVSGDAQKMPFPDGSFDIVSTNECLEHVPDPKKALEEMVRVTKPGGYVVIIGPNLLSIGMPVKALTKYVWKQRPLSRIIFRDKKLPYHPFGNTIFENIFYFVRNSLLIPVKYIFSKPNFIMRTPDLRPPFHADSDSCYLLNPLDLKYFFSDKSRFKIIQSGAKSRSKYLELIASGTWVCVQKK